MIRRFLKRGPVHTSPPEEPAPTPAPEAAPPPRAASAPVGLAPQLLPREHHQGPMGLHFRVWRWSGLLEGAGTFEGAAWVRLDYITELAPHPHHEPLTVLRATGANVVIAGPAASAGGALARAWALATAAPIAIEMWSQRPLSSGALNAGGRTHVYAVLPLLHADPDAQQQSPKYRRYPAYRFRAARGHTWGNGPLPMRYNSHRLPDRLPYAVPPGHMWHISTTDMHPSTALAYHTSDTEAVQHGDQ